MKIIVLALSFLFISTLLFAETTMGQKVTGGGIGLGSIIAVLASWSRNESILWAILHAFLGWLYVIYFVFTRK